MSLRSKGGTLDITGAHAPHCQIYRRKERHYKNLREIARTYENHDQHFITGDFKLPTRHPEETDHIGTCIFNPDDHDIEDVPETQHENQEMLPVVCWKKIT
jgi:hypothetical protein